MTKSVEELRALNTISPEYKDAISKDPMPDMGQDPITHRARRAAHLAERRHLHDTPGPVPEVSERDAKILMRDGQEITIRIYTPQASLVPPGGSPLFVAYHEGGFQMGDLTDEELNCRDFSKSYGCVCVNVEYRLAPEHPFPTYINDSWDALRWIAKHATRLGANPQAGFIIGGASAGGNICANLARLAKDEKLNPPLTGVYLCVPVIFNPANVPEKYRSQYISWSENVNDPVLRVPAHSMDAVIEGLAKSTKIDLKSPLWDPTYGDLKGYPPTYFELAALDPLRDDGLIFEQMLREIDTPTRLTLHEGFGHMFWMNYPKLEASKKATEIRRDGIKWLLSQTTGH